VLRHPSSVTQFTFHHSAFIFSKRFPMTSHSRRIGCLIIVALCLIAACSPQPAPPPTTTPLPTNTPLPSPRPTRAPAVTVAPQPTPAPAALTLWAVVAESQREAFTNLIGDISAKLEIDIAVTTKSPDGLQADIRALRLADLPLPDLIWGSQEDVGLLRQADLIQPADDGLDDEAFIPATVTGATLDGARWGTPIAADGALLLLYNKKLTPSAPSTTDELIVQSRALKQGDQYGLVAGWAEPRWFAALLTGFGGTLVNSNNEISLDTPETTAALNLLKELRIAGPPPPSAYTDGAALFAQGKAAFALDGDWSLPRYRQYSDTLDLGIAPMPVTPATGQSAAGPLNGIYVMYGKDVQDDQLAQARKIAVALTQPAAQARIARELSILPALNAALNDPAVQENPALAAVAAQAKQATGLPPVRELRCAWRALQFTLPQVLLSEMEQDVAGQQMQSAATTCLAEGSS
jgi:ABC-type glycerol-3-phosphate transport system substrate-binding protein